MQVLTKFDCVPWTLINNFQEYDIKKKLTRDCHVFKFESCWGCFYIHRIHVI